MNDYICTKHKVNYDMSINVCNVCYSEMKQRIEKLEAEKERIEELEERIEEHVPSLPIIKAFEGK